MIQGLTNREKEIVNLLWEGKVAKQIAYKLGCSVHTIKGHKKEVYRKLGVSSLGELFRKAIEVKVIKLDGIVKKELYSKPYDNSRPYKVVQVPTALGIVFGGWEGEVLAEYADKENADEDAYLRYVDEPAPDKADYYHINVVYWV